MTVQDKLKFDAYVSVGFLLKSYEAYYFLKCIEAKKYEKNYMDKIGFFEEKILKAELDVEILEKKRELMQTAMNRHWVGQKRKWC